MLLILAWTNVVDTAAIEYVDNSLIDAGLILATARGINALISVLQGTEIDAFFVTVTIGELLDPINDLIERFSAIMLGALGVLIVLKLMLEIVGHDAFNILLSGVAVVAIGALALNKRDLYQICAKLLFITIILRFGLSFVAFATEIVDETFLIDQGKAQHQTMKSYRDNLEELERTAGANPRFEKQIETLNDEIYVLNESMLERKKSVDDLKKELQGEETELKMLCSPVPILVCNTVVLPDKKKNRFKDLTIEIETLKNLIESTQPTLEESEAKLKIFNEKLECLQKKASGEKCGIWDKIKKASKIDFRSKLNQLEQDTDTFAKNTINLLASLVFKSILLPIGFLFAVVALCRRVLRLDF
jgi:prefoldin subunit 5